MVRDGACYFQLSMYGQYTQELGGERVTTASTGLYNERRAISNVKEAIGKSSLVTPAMHGKETVKLLLYSSDDNQKKTIC